MKSSIGRKILMALSGFFLLFFLLQHFVINALSVFSADSFNEVSYFMGTNPLIQYVMQPILIFGVVFHLGMGIYLDLQNKKAKGQKNVSNNLAANSSWMSRNMIITGLTVMAFLVAHFADFWLPEIVDKFIEGNSQLGKDYHHHVVEMFKNPIRVGLYSLSFVMLMLHLLHGFQSAFQSVGFRHNKYTPLIKNLGTVYAILIPLGFIFIALFHNLAHTH
jgi:succinate dehydrogenase / fumarate reductase cytochrome b subunit